MDSNIVEPNIYGPVNLSILNFVDPNIFGS